VSVFWVHEIAATWLK